VRKDGNSKYKNLKLCVEKVWEVWLMKTRIMATIIMIKIITVAMVVVMVVMVVM